MKTRFHTNVEKILTLSIFFTISLLATRIFYTKNMRTLFISGILSWPSSRFYAAEN